jgi:integrase
VRVQGAAFVDKWCKPKNRAWAEVERQFKKEINPVIGERDARTVTKRDISDLLDAIAERGSPITANRVFATLRRFFGWLVEKHVLTESPCSGVRRPVDETPRERVLTDEELQVIWKATSAFDYPFGPLWRVLLLTGQRREEVAGMEWSELSLTGNWPEWKLPGDRTKNKRPHAVPLSPLAVSMIDGLPRATSIGPDRRETLSKFVFTTTGDTHVTGYSRSKARLDDEIGRLMAEADQAASLPH